MAEPSAEFHEWALAKPIYKRLLLTGGRGLLIIRELDMGLYITNCPCCKRWLNIPHNGPERKKRSIRKALFGTLPCEGCETKLIITSDGARVQKWGTPKKARRRRISEITIPDENPQGPEDEDS